MHRGDDNQIGAAVLNSIAFPDPSDGLWHVLRTRGRQEKVLAADLRAMGISYFLPLVTLVRDYGGRKFQVEIPLFAGYVFLRCSLDQAYAADRTRRVAQIIPVPNQDRLDWELRNLAKALTVDATLDPFPYLRKGVRVEVRSGPLRGLQGLIEDTSKRDRLIIQVDMLGRAVSTEVDAATLDVIE